MGTEFYKIFKIFVKYLLKNKYKIAIVNYN